ncbi:MAG: ABC transporter ATP-binding protein [Methylovirgula sp.]|uniref:ABC transporter ATP-binding protein n=1 Tax=Methylovirgula sp. TaxID=1978224 RepID=UPI0030765F9B
MSPIISVSHLSKTYSGGRAALKDVSLEIGKGEIFALLGPNGAGKTTLISIICGIVTPTAGTITAAGHDIIRDFRAARAMIGLVPQELTIDFFESVWATVKLSRGLFGKAPDDAYLESLLRDLSLWDRKDSQARTLSGGMKRRMMIAKALSHQPDILFLDEPTAGVDVELRRGMWDLVRKLRAAGTTIILTTHYLEEAEEMADRVGVIRQGELILVEDKNRLMLKLGKKKLTLMLAAPLAALPASLQAYPLSLSDDGRELTYTYSEDGGAAPVAALFDSLRTAGVEVSDLRTEQSSLEDIFVSLIGKTA